MKPDIGITTEGILAELEMDDLIGHNIGVIAKPGGGKSGAVRVLLEATNGLMQQIILDVDDEFYTLRERYDFVLAGGDDGDIPISVDSAHRLATGLLELGVNCIIQLNEFDDRVEFVSEFLGGLMDAPKELWHPLMVVLDEAQTWVPNTGKTDATEAVKKFTSRGRKRGFTGVLASQRISRLDADVRGDIPAWLIGGANTALDIGTSANELGFRPTGNDAKELANLPRRAFWAKGPAFGANLPVLIKIADAKTTIVKSGQTKPLTAPAPEALRAALEALKPPPAPEQAPTPPKASGDAESAADDEVGDDVTEIIRSGYHWVRIDAHEDELIEARDESYKFGVDNTMAWIGIIVQPIIDRLKAEKTDGERDEEPAAKPMATKEVIQRVAKLAEPTAVLSNRGDGRVFKKQTMAMVEFLQSIYPHSMPIEKVASHAGVGIKSSMFKTYLTELPETGLAEKIGDKWKANIKSGSPRAALERMLDGLSPAYRSIFTVIKDEGPVDRQTIIGLTGISPTSSTTTAALNLLTKELGIVERVGDRYQVVEAFR